VKRAGAPIKPDCSCAALREPTARGLQIVEMTDPEDDEILQTNDRNDELQQG
jgi:hypothetical protein